jgi:hypothetical protein
MEQRHCNAYVRNPGARRPLVLVEDPFLDPDVLDLSPPGCTAFDVVVCTGPTGSETCPLVLDGTCPVGAPDLVVSAFAADHPWAVPVRAAWEQLGVVVATPDQPILWPSHLGVAIAAAATRW